MNKDRLKQIALVTIAAAGLGACSIEAAQQTLKDGQNTAATAQSVLATAKALGDQYKPQIETAQSLAKTADAAVRKLSETPVANPNE